MYQAFTAIACSTGNDDAMSEQVETTQREDSKFSNIGGIRNDDNECCERLASK